MKDKVIKLPSPQLDLDFPLMKALQRCLHPGGREGNAAGDLDRSVFGL